MAGEEEQYTVRWVGEGGASRGFLRLIDQRQLPHKLAYTVRAETSARQEHSVVMLLHSFAWCRSAGRLMKRSPLSKTCTSGVLLRLVPQGRLACA